MTRRRALATAIGASLGASLGIRLGRAQKKGSLPGPRSTPALCMFSENLKVDYNDVGPIVAMMGFDGVELNVAPGGHIPLDGDIDLHLERAIEAMTGSGLDVPVLSTTITSMQTKEMQTIMGWGSQMRVPILSPGQWPNNGDGIASVVRAQREISMLDQVGRAAKMQIAVHNATPNFVGSSVADLNAALRPFDSLVGFNFDVGFAAAYSGPPDRSGKELEAALRTALPRLKMVTARDCKWTAAGDGPPTLTQCPLGEGMVDWPMLFSRLAKANFTGPITLRVEYGPKDDLAAIHHDLTFLKKQRAAAYAG